MARWVHRSFRAFFFAMALGLTLFLTPVWGQTNSTVPLEGNQIDGYAVELDGKPIFQVRQGIPGLVSAQERAAIVNERLKAIANDYTIAPTDIRAEDQGEETIVKAGNMVLFTVRQNDIAGLNQPRSQVADKLVQQLQTAVADYRQARTIQSLTRGVLLTISGTIALLVILKITQHVVAWLRKQIHTAGENGLLGVQFQNFQLLSPQATEYVLMGLLQLARVLLILLFFYLYLPFILRQFPSTQGMGDRLNTEVYTRLQGIGVSFLQYLPNLFILLIIGYITSLMMGLAKLIIRELGRDASYTWFYPEWVVPSIRIANVLILAIAAIIAAPYLPGFNSPSFQGISIFLGALLTLGSSSAVANAIAGIILIYTRAFRIGDVVRLSGTLGSVVEKSLFVTRIQTFKGEIVTIPNNSVLGSEVTNLSFISRETEQDLVLHTTITLGYDLPWRKVHETLIKAAIATKHILPEPSPFVLQTALNDYNVSYELNACTDRPELIPQIFTELHQNIQDYCNAADIEILSPAFTALRDGNHTTIPANYLPKGYQAPGFRIGAE